MSTQRVQEPSSTEQANPQVEYCWRGQQMVRELEMFLRAGLAHPQVGRHIPFLAAGGVLPGNVAIGSGSPVKSVKE